MAILCLSGVVQAAEVGEKVEPVPELRFLSRDATATVEPNKQVAELIYTFTNTSGMPAMVEEFHQSCGCMTGEWDEKPVDPGATGKIKAKFLTTGLRGKVRKSLKVKFVEMGTVELTAEVTIPDTLTYSSQTLRWNVGEATAEKHVDITVNSEKPVKVLSVVNSDPAFTTKLTTTEEGRSYRITVTPRDTSGDKVGVFQVRTDATDPRDALQGLFAVIEKPAVATASAKGRQP
jgi:hypothetical protein